jgi:hypothetical protein
MNQDAEPDEDRAQTEQLMEVFRDDWRFRFRNRRLLLRKE